MGKDISQRDWILNTTEVMIKEIDSSINVEQILTNNNGKLLYITNIPEKKMSEITLLTNTDNNNNYLYLENINLSISYSKDPITVPGLVDIFIDIFRYSDNDAFLKNNSIHKPFSSENLGSTFSEFITKLLDTIPNGYKYNKITGSRRYSIILNPDSPDDSKKKTDRGGGSGNSIFNSDNSYTQSDNKEVNRLNLKTINDTIQDFNNKLNDRLGVENNPLNHYAEKINDAYQFYLKVSHIITVASFYYNEVMDWYFFYMIHLSTLDSTVTEIILEELNDFFVNPVVDGIIKLGEIVSDNLSRFVEEIKTPGLLQKIDRYNEAFREYRKDPFNLNKARALYNASNDLTGFSYITQKLTTIFSLPSIDRILGFS